MDRKDIKEIVIQYLSSTGKQNTDIKLANYLTREEAVQLQSILENDKTVFRVWLYTADGKYL